MIGALSIVLGFASVVWMFGWLGALASLALIGLMLLALR